MSREVLARDAAVKAIATGISHGGCAGRGRLWSVLERAHRAASTADEAKNVIAAVREEFCTGCPAMSACHNLASIGHYTGLAAGAAYEDGVRQKATWTAPKRGRVTRSRGDRLATAVDGSE